MRRLSIAALLAVPVLYLVTPSTARANPPYNGYGCGDFCLGMFKKIHQHGPLFNYGPYYGYYPFTPYGPWDQYLRYDPNFYGSGYSDGRTGHLALGSHLHGHKGDCTSCGFHHASWLQGGWFKGHTWLSGNKHGHVQSSCSSCGGVATSAPACSTCTNGDALKRYTGVGSVAQSAVFYPGTPTLNPVLDLVPVSGTR